MTIAPSSVQPEQTIPLPNWKDPASITTYIVSTATLVIGILTTLGVTVPANTSTTVSTWAGVAGIVISVGIVVFNFVRVTVLHKAAIVAGKQVSVKGRVVA